MNENDIKNLCKILRDKERDDLAQLLDGGFGELEQTSQYGSSWNSIISYYNVYLDIEKLLKINKISQSDKQSILESLLIIYPHGEGKPEIVSLDFLLLKDGLEGVLNVKQKEESATDIIEFEHEVNIKYEFLLEQIKKSMQKYKNEDLDGALTNVRTSIEAATFDIYKRITGQEITGSGSLQQDYKKIKTLLNLAPEKKTNNAAKKMVSSFISAIDGIDELTNAMGDRHLRRVRPSDHHVVFCISAANSILNFLYSSLMAQYREKDNIYTELIKILYENDNRFLSKTELMERKDIGFMVHRLDYFTKSILKNQIITEFEINNFKSSDVFFCILDLFSETLIKEDVTKIIRKHSENPQACGLQGFMKKYSHFLVDDDN